MNLRRVLLMAWVGALLGSMPAHAQLGLAAAASTASGGDLTGGSGWRAWIQPFRGLRFSVTDVDGTKSARRVLCAGLIPPDHPCPEEPAEVSSRLRHYTAGYAAVWQIGPWRLGVVPQLGLARLETRMHGRETGRTFTDDDGGVIALIAAEAARMVWTPRLTLVAGGELGGYAGSAEQCADCAVYSYEDGYGFAAVYLGIALALRGAKR